MRSRPHHELAPSMAAGRIARSARGVEVAAAAAAAAVAVVIAVVIAIAVVVAPAGCTSIYEYDECRIPGQCLREDTDALCADGQDNDEDGLTDCADPGCHPFCTEDDATWCADGRDNDGDALVDCADPGCGATQHCGENTDTKCSDGVDNNLDGPVDCADPGCCATRVCHARDLCGELVFETDFRQGPDPAHWIEHAASTGYRGEGNEIEYGPDGVALRARTVCYGWGEETGLISTVPLDFSTGRYFIEAVLRVPEGSYWPAKLMLVPHPVTGRFVRNAGVPGVIETCGELFTTPDATPAQTPSLALDVNYDGSRSLIVRQGQDRQSHPDSGMTFPVAGQRDLWRVRLDIDDEEIVLLDHDGAGWQEVTRVANPLPGRELYLALLASTDSSMFDHQMLVQRVAVHRHPRETWTVRYAEDFEASPEPAWETNNPARCRWDPATGTLDATWVAASEEYCVVSLPAPWDGESFRLRFDLWVDRQDNGTGFLPSLYDMGRNYDHSSRIGTGIGHPDAGYTVESVMCGGWERASRSADALLSRWIRAQLVYDAVHGLVEVTLFDPDSREALLERTEWDVSCPLELVKQRKLQAALEQFFVANRLAPNPNIVFNIALCLDKLGRPEEAFVYYRQLARRPDLEAADRRRVRAALARLEPRIARLEVITEPAGAVIYIDRKALGRFGRSPRVVAVKPGQRRVLVEKQKYRPARATARVAKGAKQTVRLRLERILATVQVTTPSPGARVRVDDQTSESVGQTPVTLRLPPGPHTLFVEKPGHRASQRRIVLRAHEQRKLVVPLPRLPPPTGTLQVSSNVVGALVVLDGRSVGITPLLLRDVRAGEHRIKVHAKGHRIWQGRFRLPGRGRTRVAVQLERLPRRPRRGPWPWITLGVTSASLIAASTLSGLAARAHRDYTEASEPSLQDLRQGRDLNISADALWGATAAAGLATVLTFVFTQPDRTPPSSGSVRVEPPAGAEAASGSSR